MNLQELRDVQDQERSTDSLQELPDEFYAEVAEYIQGLKDERAAAAEESAEPFDEPVVSRLTNEIGTAEQVAESIYERRTGKILTQASLVAAGVANEPSGLTTEERALFDGLVDRITENKRRVLDVLAGDADDRKLTAELDSGGGSAAAEDDDRDGAAADRDVPPDVREEPVDAPGDSVEGEREGESGGASEGVGAAGLMGPEANGDEIGGADGESETQGERGANGDGEDGGTDGTNAVRTAGREEGSGGVGDDAGVDASDDGDRSNAGDDRNVDQTTVRITRDVGDVFGVDERVYSLEAEDVVTLPVENARALVERDAATRLESPPDDAD